MESSIKLESSVENNDASRKSSSGSFVDVPNLGLPSNNLRNRRSTIFFIPDEEPVKYRRRSSLQIFGYNILNSIAAANKTKSNLEKKYQEAIEGQDGKDDEKELESNTNSSRESLNTNPECIIKEDLKKDTDLLINRRSSIFFISDEPSASKNFPRRNSVFLNNQKVLKLFAQRSESLEESDDEKQKEQESNSSSSSKYRNEHLDHTKSKFASNSGSSQQKRRSSMFLMRNEKPANFSRRASTDSNSLNPLAPFYKFKDRLSSNSINSISSQIDKIDEIEALERDEIDDSEELQQLENTESSAAQSFTNSDDDDNYDDDDDDDDKKNNSPYNQMVNSVIKSMSRRGSRVDYVNGSDQRTDSEQEDEDLNEEMEKLMEKLYQTEEGAKSLTDAEIKKLVTHNYISACRLETIIQDLDRAVKVRRDVINLADKKALEIPYQNYNYSLVHGACCENVIGFIPVPLGVAGPLIVNNKSYHVPLATTEGCLVASINRGCRAITLSGGASSFVLADGMTRGPVIRFPSAMRAVEAQEWLTINENYNKIKAAFDSTSRFARLQRIEPKVAGKYLFVRLVATTGDAMGMNMLSKGTEEAIKELLNHFPDIEMHCLSGNYCTDKKASAVNWIKGRGKSVVSEAFIPGDIIRDILKSNVDALVETNISKNLIGSALAGCVGGFNAQAANVVTAIFIATGQDAAQVITSSNCITIVEACGDDLQDLYISCTMPSIEVGTIGGGTILRAQRACLNMLEFGSSPAAEFSQVVCGTVMAAELSLLSALSQGHLVGSHMKHNRSNVNN